MTNSLRTGKIHHAIKFGKPSISIRAIYTMAMLNNQRVDHGLYGPTNPTMVYRPTFDG